MSSRRKLVALSAEPGVDSSGNGDPPGFEHHVVTHVGEDFCSGAVGTCGGVHFRLSPGPGTGDRQPSTRLGHNQQLNTPVAVSNSSSCRAREGSRRARDSPLPRNSRESALPSTRPRVRHRGRKAVAPDEIRWTIPSRLLQAWVPGPHHVVRLCRSRLTFLSASLTQLT